MKIPKIIVQTSKEKQPEYVVNMIKERAPDWEYRHFVDEEIIQYFKENPLPEFPDIIDKFLSIKLGAHKADLFRYYFLYIEGGIYIDSDAMFETNLEEIVKDYDFFTVQSYIMGLMFNGLIGCSQKNKIMYQCLKDAYTLTIEEYDKNYFILTHCLYMLLKNNNFNYNVKVYTEYFNNYHKAITLNDEGKIIFNHYFKDKIIPLIAKY